MDEGKIPSAEEVFELVESKSAANGLMAQRTDYWHSAANGLLERVGDEDPEGEYDEESEGEYEEGDDEERRLDPEGSGQLFTKAEFVDFYGGTTEWDAARPDAEQLLEEGEAGRSGEGAQKDTKGGRNFWGNIRQRLPAVIRSKHSERQAAHKESLRRGKTVNPRMKNWEWVTVVLYILGWVSMVAYSIIHYNSHPGESVSLHLWPSFLHVAASISIVATTLYFDHNDAVGAHERMMVRTVCALYVCISR